MYVKQCLYLFFMSDSQIIYMELVPYHALLGCNPMYIIHLCIPHALCRHDLMQKCWSEDESERPLFSVIVVLLSTFLVSRECQSQEEQDRVYFVLETTSN